MKSIMLPLVFASLFARGASPSPKATPISQAVSAPIIDGRLNDPCWKQVKPIPVIYPHGGAGKKPDPVPMNTWVGWGSHYLYFGFENVSYKHLKLPARIFCNFSLEHRIQGF